MSRARDIADKFSPAVAADVTEIAAGSPTEIAATSDDLSMIGNEIGDVSFVQESNRLFLWTGTGWYNIALVNTAPSITQGADSFYNLSKSGVATVITLAATDPEEVPITWSYQVTSGTLGGTTVANNGNEFTITPSTNEVDAGTFELTFTASDGINVDTSTASFTLAFGALVEILLVAGGGAGGGSPHGGGGGAGGVIHVQSAVLPAAIPFNITIGSGGLGRPGSNGPSWPSAGTNYGSDGEDTTAFGLTALGGGGGGGYSGGGSSDTGGRAGGSCGGGTDESTDATTGLQSASGYSIPDANTIGTIIGYGNLGGTSTNNSRSRGGGGAGERGDVDGEGYGGDGIDLSASFGTTVGDSGWFAGGGGGSGYSTGGLPPGGQGGGGTGGSNVTAPYGPTDGTAGTGGGGGGQERSDDTYGADGGSGVVLIKIPTADNQPTTTGAPNTHTFGDYTIYEFTQDGSITF